MQNYDKKKTNSDETEFFKKYTPDKTIHVKGRVKHPMEERSNKPVTLLFCANVNGTEKIKLFMIGN